MVPGIVYNRTCDPLTLAIGNTAADYQADFLYTPTDTSGLLAVHLRHVDGDNWLRLTFESGLARLAQTFESTYSSLAVPKLGTVPSERVFERDGTVPNFVQHVEVWRGLPGEDMARILSGTPTVIPAQAGIQRNTPFPRQRGNDRFVLCAGFPLARE